MGKHSADDAAHLEGMTDFNENQHPRANSGEFTAKSQSRPEATLEPPMPGVPVFVGWDYEKYVWHIEDGEKTIEVLAGVSVAAISSPPVGRRQDDGSYMFSYIADPDDIGDDGMMTVGTVTLGPDGEIILEVAPGAIGYDEAERRLDALRGGVDSPAPARFFVA